jgi:hypothetical protein
MNKVCKKELAILVERKTSFNLIQLALLNGIMDNGINQLMGSNLSRMTSLRLIFHTECPVKLIHLLLFVGYWLLESVCLCPSVIPLSSSHCNVENCGWLVLSFS